MSLESFSPLENAAAESHELARKALSVNELLALPKQERDTLMHESADELCDVFRENGGVEFNNIAEMYKALRGEEMIVRREDPVRLADTIAGHKDMIIDFVDGEPYSNAVEWSSRLDSRGISNAYLEGYGQYNGIVAVVGFRRTEHMDVQSLPDASQVFAGLDREYVRSIRGSYGQNDIVFVTVRIPAEAFPESDMTDSEMDTYDAYKEKTAQGNKKNPLFIHRGFLFTNHLKKQ